MTDYLNYGLFLQFVETFGPAGFRNIDPKHPLVIELERLMEKNKMFFYIGDLLQMKIIYTSEGSMRLLGISPEELTPYHFFEATHPDDIFRLMLGRAKLFRMAHDIFLDQHDAALLSTNFRIRNKGGEYRQMLIQLYCYYSIFPYKSVYTIKVHTDIESIPVRKKGIHYYVGTDMSNFRYPDHELLEIGHSYSKREYEILSLVEMGLNTEEIAEKLFISPYTVNTHRGNILLKSGKSNIAELLYDLKNVGIL